MVAPSELVVALVTFRKQSIFCMYLHLIVLTAAEVAAAAANVAVGQRS